MEAFGVAGFKRAAIRSDESPGHFTGNKEPAPVSPNKSETEKKRKTPFGRREKKHSQQLRPQDHGHRLAGVVAAEAELEEVAGAAGLGAEHAGRAPDGRQVEVFGLAGSHPDLVPQGVVDHGVALLAAGGERGGGKDFQSESE